MKKALLYFWDVHVSKIMSALMRINTLALVTIYLGTSYIGFTLSGEQSLVDNAINFFYYAITTMTTVGYGDLSPQTNAGRLFALLFVLPFGITLFGFVVAKLSSAAFNVWYRKQKGKHYMDLNDHILIIGYNRQRTPLLVSEISREESRKIVLVSVQEQENPIPDTVEFANVTSFTEYAELSRVCIKSASTIVVDTDSDDETLAIALLVEELNKDAHLVAHFIDEVKAKILQGRCKNSECIASLSTELLAKSVIDSGSSKLHSELVSTHKGQTQYAIDVPKNVKKFTIRDIFLRFKEDVDGTIVGLRKVGEDDIILNPPLSQSAAGGDTIYYIADERIEFKRWNQND